MAYLINMNRFDVISGKNTIVFNAVDISHSNLCASPMFEDLLTEETTAPNGDVSSVRVCNDISLLFNQQRLESLGREGIKQFLDSLTPKSPSLASLRSKISDADLLKVCKSRYIQSPSELLAWSSYLDSSLSDIQQEIVDSATVEDENFEKVPPHAVEG
jgi:hypothetical protein